MHIDFHYYGTYAMARAAGLAPEVCQTIATAAQFVDDNDEEREIDLKDVEGQINVFPTTHGIISMKNSRFAPFDQKTVWVPFHFLPGDEGKKFSERLICRQDSKIAREMVRHCRSLVHKPFGLHLLGIAAHVYADTFSHYGFSGVSSRWNRVEGDSLNLLNSERDEKSEERFRSKYGELNSLPNWRDKAISGLISLGAELWTGALGHAGGLTYPDLPYLEWELRYEHPERSPRAEKRNNAETFLEACEKLHALFRDLAKNDQSGKSGEGREFGDIRSSVKEILESKEPDKYERGKKWLSEARNGSLFEVAEEIPPYLGEEWKGELGDMEERDSNSAAELSVFKFFQAAATYRTYVLRDLLPSYGLVLD